MGHKRVFNIITSQCINGQWGIADIAFSITSKEKALYRMIESPLNSMYISK